MLEKSYGASKAYRQSKMANVLFTAELAKRLRGKIIKMIYFQKDYFSYSFHI
jgi:hypothetical protein